MPRESAVGKPFGRKPAKSGGKARGDGATDVKIPQDGKPGNTLLDQAWVREHEQEFTLISDLDEVPFGARLQWDGSANDVGSSFVIPTPERRCVGRAYIRDAEGRRIIDKDGLVLTRPCVKWRMKGSLVCTHHGGLTDGGLAVAKRRLQESADSVVGRLVAIALNGDTLDGDAIKAINSILDRAGIRAGSEVEVNTPVWQEMLGELFGEDKGGKEASGAAVAPAASGAEPAKPVARKRAGRRSVSDAGTEKGK